MLLKGQHLTPCICPPKPPLSLVLSSSSVKCAEHLAMKTVEINKVSKHTQNHLAHPLQVKNEFGLDLNFVLLTCAGVSVVSGFKVTPDTIWVVCYIASAVWTPTTCDVNNYRNRWRKDVVNWWLVFGWKAMERNRHKKGHWNLSFTPEAVKYDYKSWITNMSVHNLSYKQN